MGLKIKHETNIGDFGAEQARDTVSLSGRRPDGTDLDANDPVIRRLRDEYRKVEAEPVPDELLALLSALEDEDDASGA